MKRLSNILYFVFLLFFAVSARAQEGDVVVHSDPRLSLLLKKNHTVTASSARVSAHKIADASLHAAPVAAAPAAHQPGMLAVPHAGELAANSLTAKPSPSPPPAIAATARQVPAPPTAPHTGEIAANSIAKPAAPDAEVKPAPTPIIWAPRHNIRTIYTGKGYRVQIYRGTDRSKAMDIKNGFARNNPGVRTYLSYIAPCFRVKVGNYRNRSDAEGMWREANSTYNPSMIVPDIVTITTME